MNAVRRTRARMIAATTALLVAVFAGFLATAPSASAASFQPIAGAGSTWAQSAINVWAADVAQNGQQVNYASDGSTEGRAQFSQGTVNFAASEVPYGVQDGSNLNPPPTRGYAYMPDLAGGLAFAYNLAIGGQRVTNLRLSGATIAGIFTNQITRWNDPKIAADNPGLALPATPIIPVVHSESSGDTAELTQWMTATQGSSWTAYCQAVGFSPCTQTSAYPIQSGTNIVGQVGDAGVSGYVGQGTSSGTIGYVSYSSALSVGLPVAKVLNAAGYYTLPSPGNVAVSLLNAQINTDASSPLYLTANLSQVYTDTDPRTYELSFYSYLILPADTSFSLTTNQGYSLGAFGSYLLCQGQQQVDNLGYSALPTTLVEDGYAQLQKIPGSSVTTPTSAEIQACNSPAYSPDGTNRLADNDQMPPACDQQGATQCAGIGTGNGTITTVTASPPSTTPGQAVTLTATVTPVINFGTAPSGSVQFMVGNTLIGTPVTLDSSGVASTTDTFPTVGTIVVSALFTPADATAFTTSSGSVSVTVALPSNIIGMTLTTTVPPIGAFTLTVTSTNTVTMTVGGNNTAMGAMIPIVVSDTRNTYPGWSVTGQVTDFTNPTSQPAGTISGNELGWTPTVSSLVNSGVVAGGTVAPAAPGLGTTGAILASANAGGGFGTSTLGASLTLAIPPTNPSGSYTGTLTLTAVAAAP